MRMCTIYDEKQKLWSNPTPRPLSDLKSSIGQWILKQLSSHGIKIAQINDDNESRMTFHEMRLETIRVAQNLQNRGFKPRQVFGFMAANSEHLVPVFLASICLACPVVPLHPMLSKDEIVRIFTKTKPTVVFCDVIAFDETNEALKELNWDVKVFTFGGQIDGIERVENLLIETGNENEFQAVESRENDIALMSCSSGTTGPSKCACVSFANTVFLPDVIVNDHIDHISRHIIDPDCIIFTDDWLYWSVSIKPIIDSIYTGSTRLITSKPFSPQLQLKLIEQYKINTVYIATASLILCLKSEWIDKMDISSIKTVNFYGAKWPASLSPLLKRHFPKTKCVSWYGLTEVGRLTVSYINEEGHLDGAQLCEDCHAKVVDENGNRCGPGVNGELCFKAENEFLGYLDDPVANACVDDERFFHTGDVGHFDENGRLFIEDRKKNVINVFYFDGVILPSEMEESLLGAPDIKEACVVGIPVASGEALPAAVIVRKPNTKLTTRDVYNVVAENFPNRSRLRGGVYFVDSLPKTNTGKLVRRKITEMATEMFKTAKDKDLNIQSYLQDIPEEFRKMI